MSDEKLSTTPVEVSRLLREMRVVVVAATTSRQREIAHAIERLGCRVTTRDFLTLEETPLEGDAAHLIVADLEEELSLGPVFARVEPERIVALIPASLREQGAWAVGVRVGRYLIKPFHPEELVQAVRDRLELVALQQKTAQLTDQLRAQHQIENILGVSRGAEERRAFVRTFAQTRCPIFLSGERGVGKQMIAQTLHYSSPWASSPFILVDMVHVSASVLSGLLFGDSRWLEDENVAHGPGVIGLLEAGTIYITEATLIPRPLQYRLATAIREGASESPVGLRFIFGSYAPPEQLRRKGLLIEELYEQVREAHLMIEPLRARPGDIPFFVEYFLERICRQQQKEKRAISEEALSALLRHSWPENVDELKRVIEEAVRRTGLPTIEITHLPEPIGSPAPRVPKIPFPEEGIDFYAIVEEIERGLIREAFRRAGGNQRRAAQLLRLKETTLAAMRKRLGIKPKASG